MESCDDSSVTSYAEARQWGSDQEGPDAAPWPSMGCHRRSRVTSLDRSQLATSDISLLASCFLTHEVGLGTLPKASLHRLCSSPWTSVTQVSVLCSHRHSPSVAPPAPGGVELSCCFSSSPWSRPPHHIPPRSNVRHPAKPFFLRTILGDRGLEWEARAEVG